jgi:peroxiredoxin
MARLWLIAVLALGAPAAQRALAGGEKGKDVEFQVKGKLTKDDPTDAQRNGPMQTHVVRLKAGKAYTIDMVSTEMDSYLRLLDSKGNQIDEDDDGGGNLNARIVFNCSRDGDYKIVATTVGANVYGNYALTVKNNGAFQKPPTGFDLMIGGAAPTFTADFALNGRAVKLSDLKGQVVLLYFWEVRSTSCLQFLPRLTEWNKAYKGKGLAIAGLTFYPSDIGQNLAMDKDAALQTVESSDRRSDRLLFKSFAAHHKMDHLLLALPKQDAIDTFDAYAVNSLPHVVLIDRKGIVRLIDVSGERNSTHVETEFKKLLAEK